MGFSKDRSIGRGQLMLTCFPASAELMNFAFADKEL